MAATVTAKGQITIPKEVRELLGVTPGSKVEFRRSDDGAVILYKVGPKPTSRFERFRGHAGAGMTTDEIMALTRGED